MSELFKRCLFVYTMSKKKNLQPLTVAHDHTATRQRFPIGEDLSKSFKRSRFKRSLSCTLLKGMGIIHTLSHLKICVGSFLFPFMACEALKPMESLGAIVSLKFISFPLIELRFNH